MVGGLWVAVRGSLRGFYAQETHPSFRVQLITTLFNYATLPLAAIIRCRSERESRLRKILSTSSRFELTQLIVLPTTMGESFDRRSSRRITPVEETIGEGVSNCMG